MKAIVDKETCIGCGLCCNTCPEVFRLGDDGKSEAFAQATAQTQDNVQSAIDSCPVGAISWD